MKRYKALLTPGSIGAYIGGSFAVCATLMNLSAMLHMEAVIHFFLYLLSYTAHKLLCSPSTFCSSQLHVWESDYLWILSEDRLKIHSLFKKLLGNI
jgi:hypothetical protein